MKARHADIGDLSHSWCNDDVVVSSVMEAVSFVTPVLEGFFIRSVAQGMRMHKDVVLARRCQEFIREESSHSRAHKKFNTVLLGYLGRPPRGLAMVSAMLEAARRLSVSQQLGLAAALEHLTAVMSKLYVGQQHGLKFASLYAQELFAMHAEEELGHRSVVFDLWQANEPGGRFNRFVIITLVLLVGSVYVVLAVPWILYRKMDRRLVNTLITLVKFTVKNIGSTLAKLPFLDLFSFIRGDFHPERLIDDGKKTETNHTTNDGKGESK
ncbi:MAG: metal-dependent hydrolase [Nitrosomonadales bacterium]